MIKSCTSRHLKDGKTVRFYYKNINITSAVGAIFKNFAKHAGKTQVLGSPQGR